MKAFVFCLALASCPLVIQAGLATCTNADKRAKATVCAMDHALVGLGEKWKTYSLYKAAMEPFWAHGFVYTPAYGIPETVGVRNWYSGEWLIWFKAFPTAIFNQMLFLGDDMNASSMTYALGTWEGNLGPLAPTWKTTTVRIMDAYTVVAGRITHDWMMIDMLDLLRQAGYHPLPVSPLPQGLDYPPMAMDGIPAPISAYVNPTDTSKSRRILEAVLSAEWAGNSLEMEHWSDNMVWYGPVPFGMARGKAQYKEYFLKPLHNAFADRAIVLDMITCEGHFCAAHGSFSGVLVGKWLGQKATHERLQLNFGMHWHVVGERIVESWAIFDLPRYFLQMGVDLLGNHSFSNAAHEGHSHRAVFLERPQARRMPSSILFAGALCIALLVSIVMMRMRRTRREIQLGCALLA